MNSKIIRDTMDAVFKELMAMSNSDLLRELDLKGDGDIAAILRYTGALKAREMEATLLGEVSVTGNLTSPDYNKEHNIDLSDIVQPVQNPPRPANNDYISRGPFGKGEVALYVKNCPTYMTGSNQELQWAA